MNNANSHLGGHLNKTHIDEGALKYLIDKFKLRSFIDIGCGPGGQVKVAAQLGLHSIGIDGDKDALSVYNEEYEKEKFNFSPLIHFHDYTSGPLVFPINTSRIKRSNAIYRAHKNPDLAWSVEFLEHVEEQYQENYMQTFQQAKFAAVTHALPNQPGYHHVNCQTPEYWKSIFNDFGFDFDEKTTIIMREKSTMVKPFLARTGLFFRKR